MVVRYAAPAHPEAASGHASKASGYKLTVVEPPPAEMACPSATSRPSAGRWRAHPRRGGCSGGRPAPWSPHRRGCPAPRSPPEQGQGTRETRVGPPAGRRGHQEARAVSQALRRCARAGPEGQVRAAQDPHGDQHRQEHHPCRPPGAGAGGALWSKAEVHEVSWHLGPAVSPTTPDGPGRPAPIRRRMSRRGARGLRLPPCSISPITTPAAAPPSPPEAGTPDAGSPRRPAVTAP